MIEELFRASNVCVSNIKGHGLRDLSFSLFRGEILGIYGNRYAGRGRLFQLIRGEIQPERGSVFWNGEKDGKKPVVVQAGQTQKFLEELPVWENIAEVWGRKKTFRLLNVRRIKNMIRVLLRDYQIEVDLNTRTSELSPMERLILEILSSLRGGMEVLLIDLVGIEVTMEEFDRLKTLLLRLKMEGITIVISTHLIKGVCFFADRIALLHQGRILKIWEREAVIQNHLTDPFSLLGGNRERKNRTLERKSRCLLRVEGLDIGIKEPVAFTINEGEYDVMVCSCPDAWKLLIRGFNGEAVGKRSTITYEGRTVKELGERDGVYFLDAAYLDRLVEGMTPLENLSFGILDKKGKIVRESFMQCLEQDFYEWYGHKGLLNSGEQIGLYRKHRVAVNLFRLRLLKPRLIFCSDLNIHNDAVTYQMVEDALGEMAEMGCAVCIVTGDLTYRADGIHRYLVYYDGYD